MTVTQMHLLEKCHAYKDKKARGLAADAGLFTYPVLMAADILIYDSTTVPVGADQIQHVEVTRDLAQRFNSLYGETLTLPESYVLDASAKVPGTDGEKMSKSYNNTIPIFESPGKLRKLIMSIKTDSTPMEAPKNPDTCAVFELYRLFASPEEQSALASRYREGGMGYGEAKETLYQAAMAHFQDAFARRSEFESDADRVESILQNGAAAARAKARRVLDRAKQACGLTR
jgi:tryptophanyl-tRNA synthetase